MAIIASNAGGTTFKQVPPGSYIARCYSVIHMGTYNGEYMGKPKTRNEVRIAWEIPDEMIEGENGEARPSSISKTYTLSLNEKAALRKDLEAWRGKAFTEEDAKGFDVARLLGAACMLTVSEYKGDDGQSRSYVAGVGKLGKGMACKPAWNKPTEYSVTQGKNEAYLALPEWLKKKIDTCLEWTHPAPAEPPPAETAPTAGDDQGDPEVPF